MTEWRDRLTTRLEPILSQLDPRPQLSVYHDMPCAIFHYPPEDEFALRQELSLLQTRLEQRAKRVTRISLAHCLDRALEAKLPFNELAEAERKVGVVAAIETVHEILSTDCRLDDLVLAEMPPDPDPQRDIALIHRAGALFPVYRVFPLLEHLKGRLVVPTVLFYPGILEEPAGLRFMGVVDAEHNYRPKIF